MRRSKQPKNEKIMTITERKKPVPAQNSCWQAFFVSSLQPAGLAEAGQQGARVFPKCRLLFRHLGYQYFIHIVIHKECTQTREKT